jgi:hypothetical protein
MLGAVVCEIIPVRFQTVRAEPRTGKESRDIGNAMEISYFLPVVVIKEDLLLIPAVVQTHVRKGVPSPCTDDVETDVEKIFQHRPKFCSPSPAMVTSPYK